MDSGAKLANELQLVQETSHSIARYACKKCRCVLFTNEDLDMHEPEKHQISVHKKLKDVKQHVSAPMACSSYFLESPLSWMDEKLLAEGKIHCPTQKCQSRLGALHWSGSQCSCGTWVTPSIKITKSRVDLVLKHSNLNIVTSVTGLDSTDAVKAISPVS
ncbi:dual specificity protein phosphatase 12-like [Plasmopara halstedii]|uniref:protein-tyrosine-phosphatase n=1 Tax=Plasmopara halstedii TaxID=4781 RepID=A0A0P1A6P7_PLAHL|nr:dual specificity protein phosphatase 12-like [Plasmopara halstedii]CEG35906.1 dual specificity protein phosphatase 12-like [Plasmopara halstedii]|eukprot:XP_024572275.1 dual specificity protein phosphatase 12-like [Plasmopara halstedii]